MREDISKSRWMFVPNLWIVKFEKCESFKDYMDDEYD